MKIYSLFSLVEISFLSDFLFIPIKDVLLLGHRWSLKPFFNPVVIAPIKKNPMNNHISLSKKIKGENACPDLTISVSGSNGSKCFIWYVYIDIV
tara:strand:+ start:142 stop:423 length:282 start_codon:yes stop_codon:yes gene_type:complete